ncbi:MAG TPA: sporulation protein Cse60 [Nitrososphaeraceae archaeon]
MIKTLSFVSSSVSSVSDDINKWLETYSDKYGTKFRLIDIKYAVAAESVPKSSQTRNVNYSALIIYEIVETKKQADTSEPLETSGVE